eukprot:NODE_4_length_77007_cov_1.156642.p2 type:complete len:947 gc:universal NODE_4_length_77007_cov_1.156642:45835-48675(+)
MSDSFFDDSEFDRLAETEMKKKKKTHHLFWSRLHQMKVLSVKIQASETILICSENQIIFLTHQWKNCKFKPGQQLNVIGKGYYNNDKTEFHINNEQGLIIVEPQILINVTDITSSLFCTRQGILNNLFLKNGLLPFGKKDYSIKMIEGTVIHKILQECLQKKDFSLNLVAEILDRAIVELIPTFYQMKVEESTFRQKILNIFYTSDQLKLITNGTDIINRAVALIPDRENSTVNLSNERSHLSAPTLIQTLVVDEVIDIEQDMSSIIFGMRAKADVVGHVRIHQSSDEYGDLTSPSIVAPVEIKTGKCRQSDCAQLSLYLLLMSEKYCSEIDNGCLLYIDEKILLVPLKVDELRSLLIQRHLIVEALEMGTYNHILGQESCIKCSMNIACASIYTSVENKPISSFGVEEFKSKFPLNSVLLKVFNQFIDAFNLINCDDYKQRNCIANVDEKLLDSGKKCIITLVEPYLDDRVKTVNIYINRLLRGHGYVQSYDPFIVDIVSGDFTNDIDSNVEIEKCTNHYFDLKLYRTYVLNFLTHGKPELKNILFGKSTHPKYLKKYSYSSKELNLEQNEAVGRILNCQDCTLVEGFPGTGKSKVICESIKAIKTNILLVCLTNNALDNILLRLLDSSTPFFRVYAKAESVHPKIVDYMTKITKDVKTTHDYAELIKGIHVFATTSHKISSPFLEHTEFDLCIIDEATQISFPLILGPLSMCKRFVLVGDSHQLPPILQLRGFQPSVFEHLRVKFPDNATRLTTQYRMNPQIMDFANALVYNSLLKLGKKIEKLQLYMQNDILFYNTDSHHFKENQVGDAVHNHGSALACVNICRLLSINLESHQYSIISPYRGQIEYLKTQISDVELATIDRWQGREKQVIIFDTVKTKDSNIGKLLLEWRRINVAFTRARVKLIIIGSVELLSGENSNAFWKDCIKYLTNFGFIEPLPSNLV